MKKNRTIILIFTILTLTLLISSCEFIFPKTMPLFIKIQDDYAWVTSGSSITLSFYTNYDISDCTIKIDNDTITQSNVLSIVSTSIEYNGVVARAKKYTVNLSNYTKVSTNDVYFDFNVSVTRKNQNIESEKRIYFGKLIKKTVVKQSDLTSGYSVYELYNPQKLDDLSITSTVIVKTISENPTILVNESLNINGGTLVFDSNSNPLTLSASGSSWNGINLINNGDLLHDKVSKIYIINANPGISISSSNKDYTFKNIIFNNNLGSLNTGIYNSSQSNIKIIDSDFHHCGAAIKNYGSGDFTIQGCNFDYQKGSIEAYGSNTIMKDCNLSNLSPKDTPIKSSDGDLTLLASPAVVVGSNFSMNDCSINSYTVGIYIRNSVNSLKINNNKLTNNTLAILFNSDIVGTPNVSVSENLIKGNVSKLSTPSSITSLKDLKDCGIVLHDCRGSIFTKNHIENYSYGVAIFDDNASQFYSTDEIGNDIINSNVYSINPSDLAHTYWGTTDESQILKRLNSSSINITPIATSAYYK